MEKNLNKDNFNKKENKENEELSRRSFLKKLAIFGAGSAILGTAGIFSYFKNKENESSEIERRNITSKELEKKSSKIRFLV